MNRLRALKLITRGVERISCEQAADGSFVNLSASASELLESSFASVRTTTFFTACALNALNTARKTLIGVEKSETFSHTRIAIQKTIQHLDGIRQKAAGFLLRQASDQWTFNYWPRNSPEYSRMPYPDDLDDTCCALSALYGHDPNLLGGSVMAAIAKTLIGAETEIGGPYRTWLVPQDTPEIWRDVDVAVNANVQHFLHLQEILLPNITSFTESAIKDGKLSSPYYSSELPLIYFISRWYRGGKRVELIERLRARGAGTPMNPLEVGLIAASLANFGAVDDPLFKKCAFEIEAAYRAGTMAKAYPFCIDPSIDGVRFYAGSRALTAAVCVESFAARFAVGRPQSVALHQVKESSGGDIATASIRSVIARFQHLPDVLRKHALQNLEATLRRKDIAEIILLPHLFRESLQISGNNALSIRQATHEETYDLPITLGSAALYGWIAYTLYDNILDNEPGGIRELPVANVCLRELTAIYASVFEKFQSRGDNLFQRIMDSLENANACEQAFCRFMTPGNGAEISALSGPDFGSSVIMAHKSIGHALGPIAVLLNAGFSPDSSEVRLLMTFFEHYLAARQMLDDAHDWLDDLGHGQINSVGALVLNTAGQAGMSVTTPIREQNDLRTLFWRTSAPSVFDAIRKHLESARAAGKMLAVICDQSFFERLLAPLTQSVHSAVSAREQVIRFLDTF